MVFLGFEPGAQDGRRSLTWWGKSVYNIVHLAFTFVGFSSLQFNTFVETESRKAATAAAADTFQVVNLVFPLGT